MRPSLRSGRGERLRARPVDETASKKLCAAVEKIEEPRKAPDDFFGHRKRPPQVDGLYRNSQTRRNCRTAATCHLDQKKDYCFIRTVVFFY